MSDEPDFDSSERKRIRHTVELVNGNGRRGIAARLSVIEAVAWIIACAVFGLWVEGRLRVQVTPSLDRIENVKTTEEHAP